jgi:V/A-type H+-transporting ATPase subunit I
MFFNSPGKNPFINFGLGLWGVYNMVTGLFGDILSYIRLFALGLSSAILGNVFNSLAFGMAPDIPVVGAIVTILILVAGHSINLFMAALGSLVHPMRLIFVEFYKNSGFIGGGKTYQPFEKKIKQTI